LLALRTVQETTRTGLTGQWQFRYRSQANTNILLKSHEIESQERMPQMPLGRVNFDEIDTYPETPRFRLLLAFGIE
jgi:hypothetical protein